MDNGKLGEIIGASIANGTMPTAERVASVLTDPEILYQVRLRKLELSPVIGGVATESVANDALEVSETLPNPATPESLLERAGIAHKGYTDFVNQLNIRREEKGKDTILRGTAEKLAEELKVWATPEKVEYINKVLEADPTLTYTVTATPNELVSGQEVIDSGRQFGYSQPYATEVLSDILTRYTDAEVLEANERNKNTYAISVRFSKPTLNTGNRDTQNRDIAKMQKDIPFLRPTTPLEDDVYVRTLRAEAGGVLKGNGVFEATITRFPQMDRERIDDFQYVPRAFVNDHGKRGVGYSDVDYYDSVAVVLG